MFIAPASRFVSALPEERNTEKCSAPPELGQNVRRSYKHFASLSRGTGSMNGVAHLFRVSFSL